MPHHIKLTEMERNRSYQIAGFVDGQSDYSEKLCKMGFIVGTFIQLAPVDISDPIVFQIRGSRIALRKNEAQQILVKEC